VNNRIAELRSTNGLTQQALADELEVSRQTVISLEKGKYNPSIMLAHRIAARFGLTIEQVFIFEEGE
jgi:putative transcriptional regulator